MRIYADSAQRLIVMAHNPYIDEPIGVDLEETVYALDTRAVNRRPGLTRLQHRALARRLSLNRGSTEM